MSSNLSQDHISASNHKDDGHGSFSLLLASFFSSNLPSFNPWRLTEILPLNSLPPSPRLASPLFLTDVCRWSTHR